MFRPAIMHELEVIIHNNYKDRVIEELHKQGITHIEFLTDNNISEINEKFKIDLKRASPSERDVIVSKKLVEIYKVIEILSRFETKKRTFIEEMLGIEKIEKKKIERMNFEEVIKYVENVLKIKDGENGVFAIPDKIESKKAELLEIKKKLDEISELSEVIGDFDMGVLGTGIYYTIFIALFEDYATANILESMYKNGEISYIKKYKIEKKKKITNIAIVIVPNENADSVIQKISGARILKEKKEGTIEENVKILTEKISEIEKEINNLNKTLKEIFDKYYEELLICKELLEIEKERCKIFVNGGATEKTVYFKIYTPAQLSDKIKKVIEEKSEGICAIKINKDLKNAPTLMENPEVIKKYEFLIKIYGVPKYNHIDPSIAVVPAAALLIGLMIADACFGIILMIIALMLRKKYGHYSEELKNFMSFLAICGAVAIGVGVINGEYFGNLGHIIYKKIDPEAEYLPLQLFHPVGKDMKLYLQIAIGFGAIHIWFGTLLGIYDALRRKEIKEAVYRHGGWCLFGLGMIMIFFGPFGHMCGFPFTPFNNEFFTNIALAFFGIGFLLALKHEPALSFIEAIDYFAFVLSYARIAALIIAASAIATAFNQLAGMAWGIAFGIFAVLIFIMGQALHFFLGVLTAFIQALRLLYVEHFSRYYEGGGYEFKPFMEKRKYTYVEE